MTSLALYSKYRVRRGRHSLVVWYNSKRIIGNGAAVEIRQIEIFVTVADERHFRRAADRLYMSEQALGQQIRKFEGELGFRLFDRSTRSVELTPEGAALIDDARRLLAQAARTEDTARHIAAGELGTVRLGYESSTVVSILPKFVIAMRAEHPGIDLMLIEHNKAGLASLDSGETDACLIACYSSIPKRFEFHLVKRELAYVALPAGHPLAQSDGLGVNDLKGVPFLGYADANGESPNRFMAQLFTNVALEAPIQHEADSYVALLGLVSAGMGFTFVTGSMRKLFAGEVAYVPFIDPAVYVDYGLALRVGETLPAADALRAVADKLA